MTSSYTKRLSRANIGPFRSILAVADDIFGAAYSEMKPANSQWLDNHSLGFGRTTMGPNETRFLWGGTRRRGENRPDPLQALAMGHDAPPMGPDETSSSR